MKYPLFSFRLSLIMLFLIVLASTVSVDAQVSNTETTTRKSVKLTNVTVQDLVNSLGSEFKYSFFIIDDAVGKSKVDVDVTNATIREILDAAFNGREIVYSVKGKNITISSKKIPVENAPKQARVISGVVTDSNSEPIIGASIKLLNANTGTISDLAGRFSLEVPQKGQLLVSYIGYVSQTLQIGPASEYKIVLIEDNRELEEVIVVGYGTQRKGNLTGSITSVKSDKLTVAPITNVTNMLGGQLAGLKTKQTSGIPGADGSRLSIRGFNSPLVIVDGVETSFSNIDASQIESISVLKDGAASIYGARAGNGVVLVTLKRGVESKVTVTANGSLTVQNSTTLIQSGSSGQRSEWEREAHLNANLPASQIPWTLTQIQKFYQGTDPAFLNTDWFSAAIRPWAPQQNHNLSVSGGTSKLKFYSYLGYNNQQTISRNDGGGYNRLNFQTSVDAQLMEGLSLSSSVNYIREQRDFTSMNLASSNYYYALYDSDPRYALELPDPAYLSYAGSSYGNALFVSSRMLAGYSRSDNHNFRLNASLSYDLPQVKGLRLKAFYHYNSYYGLSKVFRKQPEFYSYKADVGEYLFERKSQDPTMLAHGVSYSDDLTQQYSLNYENTFDEVHRITALLLHERIDYKNEGFDTQRGNLTSSVIDQLFAGDPTTASNNSSASEMARASYVGRVNYGYKNRYLVETIFRADASAKFPKNGRWGYFPSVSLGWVINEEEFMNNLNGIDLLKLRASLGQSGDDGIGNYQYYAGYSYDMSYILGSNILQGIYSTGLANSHLSWERISIYNGGLDFSFWQHKMYGTIEAFYRLRDGIPGYRTQSLPSTFGASLPLENLNSIDTRGFELELGTKGKSGQLLYDVSANLSWARNKWVAFDEPEYIDEDQKRIYGVTGKWTDERYGYVTNGLFTSMEEIANYSPVYSELGGNESIRPGDVKYVDMNDDGKIDWRDQVKIGQGTLPNWMVGLNSQVKYLNFDMSMLLQGAFGYTSYIDLESAPTALKYENRWTEKENNPNSMVPRPGSKNIANWWYSDYRNHNASYVRIKNLSLGYNAGKEMLKKTGLSQMRVYLAGTNLLTLSSLSKYGVDPEAPEGTPAYYYPQQRTISCGLMLSY